MLWEILSLSYVSSFGRPRLWAAKRPPFVLVDGYSSREKLLLIGPEQGFEKNISSGLPALVFSREELQDSEAWQSILALHDIPIYKLATFERQDGLVPPEILLSALGQKVNYKTLEDWQAWAELDENASALALDYGFPVHILTLWNRLPLEERLAWQDIWKRRRIKKNFIRQIIEYYYELSEVNRAKALKQAKELDVGWGTSKAIFPAEELRAIVYEARFPKLSENKKKVDLFLKNLNLPKKAFLKIPQEMEAHELEICLKFQDAQELHTQLERLLDKDLQEKLQMLFSLL